MSDRLFCERLAPKTEFFCVVEEKTLLCLTFLCSDDTILYGIFFVRIGEGIRKPRDAERNQDFMEFIELFAQMIDAYRDAEQIELLKYAFLVALLPSAFLTLVLFLLRAIGLYRLNTRLGNKGAFLAFIPGLSGYALGAAADGLKKRKPSNYQIHMLMLGLFYFALNAIIIFGTVGRFLYLFEQLEAGVGTDTVTLLERILYVDKNERLLYLSYAALQILSYVVKFVLLLCYMRILQLYRKGGFLLLLVAIVFDPVMDIYLFAMRNKPIHQYLPVFRMPDGTVFNPNGEGYEQNDEEPIDFGEDGSDKKRDEDPSDGEKGSDDDVNSSDGE